MWKHFEHPRDVAIQCFMPQNAMAHCALPPGFDGIFKKITRYYISVSVGSVYSLSTWKTAVAHFLHHYPHPLAKRAKNKTKKRAFIIEAPCD